MHNKISGRLVFGLAGSIMALAAPQVAMAQPVAEAEEAAVPFSPAEVHEVVQGISGLLLDYFVFPDIGKAYAALLSQKLAAGAYDHFPSAEAFAQAVTADLQAVQRDGHLRVLPPLREQRARPTDARQSQTQPSRGVQSAGWIAPDVAYIRFGGFPGDPDTVKAVQDFLVAHADARALIIDVRPHRGGGTAEMDAIFSYLFKTRTELVQMDTRTAAYKSMAAVLEGVPTLQSVAAPEGIVRYAHFAIPLDKPVGLMNAQVFLLTSRRTVSAGEHLSLALKRTGRATLIGETTRGAGHFGSSHPLAGGYSVFIPVGRTFDPVTNQGWEEEGVTPHVSVPADEALVEALRRAGVDPAAANMALVQ